MIPEAVITWLDDNEHGSIINQQSVAGGCINNGTRLETSSAENFFLKSNSSAPQDMFAREAEGLEELRSGVGPRFPKVFLVGADFLLLEDLAPASRGPNYWETLGRQLAQLHQRTKPQFGFAENNYIGSTPQPNPWTDNGFEFFAEHRLGFQARLARDNGLLSGKEAAKVDMLCTRLPELLPEEPTSLIHGDLWSGNVISDSAGQPALIDPAAHFGWRESELGMTKLFGSFDERCYIAYDEIFPLDSGWKQRLPIYNLYHLLNHLNLFGPSYHQQVLDILHRFA